MTLAVAMSGGVDSSSVAALLAPSRNAGQGLAEQNPIGSNGDSPRVIGLTMQLWNQRRLPHLQGLEESAATPGQASGRCCSLDDAYDARRVAQALGIPHYVLRLEDQFEEHVVRPFVEQYLAGETPIPCIPCNTRIKFDEFIRAALQLGAERIATGHYARLRWDETAGRYRLLRGIDRSKDQSYFLFGLTQQQLARSLFPLGELTKEQVRAIARERSLPVADKPESQEICFVSTGRYRDFIEAYSAEQGQTLESRLSGTGEVVTTAGKVLGEHRGLHGFTVGQRKGLGVATGQPLYVIELDRARNRVVVGSNEELLRRSFVVREVNWICPVERGTPLEASVKIRNNHAASPARLEARGAGEALVEFREPQRAITPGQAAVFYSGDEVLGGGWIAQVL